MIMKNGFLALMATFIALSFIQSGCSSVPAADMILINGKIVTVDRDFNVVNSVAVSDGKILATGSGRKIRKLAGNGTKIIDLKGSTVVPGLIDSHLHPESASVSELDEEIPDLHNIDQLLNWIKDQAAIKEKGAWIIHPKLFFTRLIELRQPSLHELDSVAPFHPVFLNGSFGGMINTAAMKASGISDRPSHPGILTEEKTGRATGFIRASAFGLLKIPVKKTLSAEERDNALVNMFCRYNRYGITSICSASGNFETVKMFRGMKDKDLLTVRIYQNILVQPKPGITVEEMSEQVKKLPEKTGDGNEWVRVGSLKIYLDGGILTGTAYLREPWGENAQRIFGIEDPTYKGIINYSRDDLVAIVTAANRFGWSFTAHATGGGSVDVLLDVFNEVNNSIPVAGRRFSIIHGNFYTSEAVTLMKKLDVYANMQPAWFYKDADAMESILGRERIRTFHAYRTMTDAGIMINGGSDHMVKWDANSSINPYNPFLAMWTIITRTTERGTVIFPEEAVTREEALRMYTINNAWASFEESIKGSIEPGKLADLTVLSKDLLTCQPDEIRNIESLLTIVGGKIVYSAGGFKEK
jgi:predicted amidohydrolase YtcJ